MLERSLRAIAEAAARDRSKASADGLLKGRSAGLRDSIEPQLSFIGNLTGLGLPFFEFCRQCVLVRWGMPHRLIDPPHARQDAGRPRAVLTRITHTPAWRPETMARWFVDRSPQRGIPSVSLRRLLPDARFLGCDDLLVSGCAADSRRLDPGQVFVALRGPRRDGHEDIPQALDRGAVAVVVEEPRVEAGSLQVVVPDTRLALAKLCQALAGDPSRHLRIVGVTGRSGKTATGLFLRAILEADGGRYGMISPYDWSDGVEARPGPVSPGAEELARMLSAMVEHRCAGGVLEVDEESLARREFDGVRFDAAIVTDLIETRAESPEVRQARRARTARLFRKLGPGGLAIVNGDDRDAELMGAVSLDARRVSFGIVDPQRPSSLDDAKEPVDVVGRIESMDASGTRLRIFGLDREAVVRIRPIGSNVVARAVAAAAFAWARGIDTHAVVAGLESVSKIPGRFEPIDEGQKFLVHADRCRTGDDLRRSLATLRELNPSRLICVLGAEGLRERAERLELAEAAELGADQIVLTGDNPRTEDPNKILDELLSGFRRPGRVLIEADRKRAIENALSLALPGDSVLIACNGRSPYQIQADRAVAFNEQSIAADALRRTAFVRSTA